MYAVFMEEVKHRWMGSGDMRHQVTAGDSSNIETCLMLVFDLDSGFCLQSERNKNDPLEAWRW